MMRKQVIFFSIIFMLGVLFPDISFSATDQVKIRVGVDTCDQDAVCEVLFGENYPACPLDCEAPPAPVTPTSTKSSSSGKRGGEKNVLTDGGFFGGGGIEVFATSQSTFFISWFDVVSDSYVKLVRSPFGYPKTVDEGRVVYEGTNKFTYDNFLPETSYYTLFIKQNNGLFTSVYFFTNPNKVFVKDVLSNVGLVPSKDLVSSKDFSLLEKKSKEENFGELFFSITVSQKDKKISPIREDVFSLEGIFDTRIYILYENFLSKEFEYTLDLGSNTSGGTKKIFNFVKGEKRAEILVPRFLFAGIYPARIKITNINTKKVYFYDFLLKVDRNYLPEDNCVGVNIFFDKKCEKTRSFPLKKYIKILENLLK